MLLRATIIFLLVLNLGIAAWWVSGGNVPPAVPVPAQPAGVPRLHLVQDTEAPVPKSATPAPAAAPADAVPTTTAPAPAAVPEVASEPCLRVGPFADAASRDAARPALAGATTVVSAYDTPGKSARGWKVQTPAYATRDEARAMGEKIKAAGINDWYVLNEGADANAIALGRYGGEDSARRREAELLAKGIPARAQPLDPSGPQWWLQVKLAPGVAGLPATLAVPTKAIDCTRLR